MADFIPVPNCIQVKLGFTDEGDNNALCLGYVGYTGGPPSATDLNTYVGELSGTATDTLIPEMTSDKTLVSIEARDLASDTGAEAIVSPASAGTRMGTKLAPGTCAVTSYTINRHYRGGHPRNYWPFGAEADIGTFGLWADAFVTEFEGNVGLFWASAGSSAFPSFTTTTQVNASRYKGYTNMPYGTPTKYRRVPTPRAPAITDRVTGVVGRKVIGSQRRRNRNA
jgi:hypothetical protein